MIIALALCPACIGMIRQTAYAVAAQNKLAFCYVCAPKATQFFRILLLHGETGVVVRDDDEEAHKLDRLRLDVPVWYWPSDRAGPRFLAIVDGPPKSGPGGTWTVPLRGMGRDYREYTHKERDTVPAAAISRLDLWEMER